MSGSDKGGEAWEAYKDVHGHDFWHVKESRLGIGIALVHAHTNASPIESTVEERARLIAAAPPMREALRHCLAFAEHELELRKPSGDPEYIAYAQKAVDTASEALLKADGHRS